MTDGPVLAAMNGARARIVLPTYQRTSYISYDTKVSVQRTFHRLYILLPPPGLVSIRVGSATNQPTSNNDILTWYQNTL